MSDLPGSRALKPNTSQLPVSWYFDPKVFELEQKLLFGTAPGYVGHELMVPNPGDYHALSWMDNGKVLVRNSRGIELLSNVCRHRQSILLEVLSKTMILEHVWDYHFDPQTNVVDVLVSRLRQKIDRDRADKLIHTIRGVGYVLRAT